MTMAEDYVARRLEASGIVQGVGFRPFVYQLAKKYDLKGDVANTSTGVTIYIEGALSNIESFSQDLAQKNPPLSCITKISVDPEAVKNTKGFTIAKSKNSIVNQPLYHRMYLFAMIVSGSFLILPTGVICIHSLTVQTAVPAIPLLMIFRMTGRKLL